MITVLFTRPYDRMVESMELATSMGFDPIGIRAIEVVKGDCSNIKAVSDAISKGEVDIVIFSSATAVSEYYDVSGTEGFSLGKAEIMAMGPGTFRELRKYGLNATVPDDHSSVGMVDLLKDRVKGKAVAIMRSDKGSDVLREGLERAGANISEIFVYSLECSEEDSRQAISKHIDVYAFTSTFSAKCFLEMSFETIGKSETERLMGKSRIAAIGQPTADYLSNMGFKVDMIPERCTFQDMLMEIRKQVSE